MSNKKPQPKKTTIKTEVKQVSKPAVNLKEKTDKKPEAKKPQTQTVSKSKPVVSKASATKPVAVKQTKPTTAKVSTPKVVVKKETQKPKAVPAVKTNTVKTGVVVSKPQPIAVPKRTIEQTKSSSEKVTFSELMGLMAQNMATPRF